MDRIIEPGIYRDFDTAAYFEDPCPEPSFTQSLAKILIEQSPLHAFQAHPRLTVRSADEDDGEKYDKNKAIGNAAHALMLGRGKKLVVAEFDDWRKKAAQEFRADAIENGHEPILRQHYETAREMVEIARLQIASIAGCELAFVAGEAEVVIANCEDGLWLRSMIDWLSPDLLNVFDYKTSGQSASPYATGRLMASAGWHVQAAMHERILDALKPADAGRRRFLYVCQENEKPYALTVNEISESALTIGRKQVDYAVRIWRDCMKRNRWPAYPPVIIRPELPGWHENGWLEREEIETENLMMAG